MAPWEMVPRERWSPKSPPGAPPPQAPVQASHSQRVPVPGVQTLLCSVSLFKTPSLTSWPAYGKEWTFVEPETLQS